MKFFNRIKSAFYALTHDTTTISLLDERFWTQYGSIRNSKLSEVTYFTCLKTLSEAVAKLPLKMYQETPKGVSKAKNTKRYWKRSRSASLMRRIWQRASGQTDRIFLPEK